MMSRKRLPDRRHSEILELELHGLRYTGALLRDAQGCAPTPLGAAIDHITAIQKEPRYAKQQQRLQKFLREQESPPGRSQAEQTKQESVMNEVVKPPLDGFWAFEDATEGDDSPANRLIQGQLVKFTNEATWVARNGEELSRTLELVAVNVARVVQKWKDEQPTETIILEPGQKFPDLEKFNDAVPKSEWREGPDGKLRGPWQAQYLVYLLNAETVDRYTYVTATTGGGIAVRDLVDRTRWMRKFRGANVYAVVTLSDTFMPTRYGGRQRPQFLVKRWARLSDGGTMLPATEQPTLAAPQAVEPPTPKEEMSDDIPF